MEDNKTALADSIIRNHVLWSAGAGMIPIPIADIAAVSAVQLDMIKQLCRVYDAPYTETQGKALISSMTSSTLAKMGSKIGIRMVAKLIPGVGTMVGGVAMAISSGASTYALGEVYKKHFETGGTFLDFDADSFKKFYAEKFEKGQQVTEELRKEQAASKEGGFKVPSDAKPSDNQDLITQLRELASLRDAGILSEAEFEAAKKKIL